MNSNITFCISRLENKVILYMKYHFITFGGGGQNYINAGKRLIREMQQTNLFHHYELYSDIHLKNDRVFWKKHGSFINTHKKGFGFYIWKPYLLNMKMNSMKDGDILMYLDAGCEMDLSKKSILQSYFGHVKKDFIIGTQCGNGSNGLLEKYWTKSDLFTFLDAKKENIMNSPQRQGGTLLIYVNEKTRHLVKMWYETCCIYHNLDNSPSLEKIEPGFVEHRHDQSIFSVLSKKFELFSQYSLYNCGVLVSRNISGVPKIKQGTRKPLFFFN